jgi:sterol desaturase/sphingolipid hydroxylase (fatty acid hydroxylase superfamily)
MYFIDFVLSILPMVSYRLAVPFYRQFESQRSNDISKINISNKLITTSSLANLFIIFNLYNYVWEDLRRIEFKYIIYGMLITDTLEYFTHRIYHLQPLYKKFHKVHHSQEISVDVSFLNSELEATMTSILLFLSYFLVISYYEYIIVTTLSMISTAADHTYTSHTKFHYIHHHVNRNYNFQQPFFTFWDHLLGTYHPQTTTKIPFLP